MGEDKLSYELENKFSEKIIQNGMLSEAYRRLHYEKIANNVLWCGTELEFKVPISDPAHGKLYRANFCKTRLCPMCSWRRSKKIFGQVSKIMDKIQEDYAFIFITYTVKNCRAEDLSNTIDLLLKAFYKMHDKAKIKKAVKGFFRTVEVTRHPEYPNENEYHPHIHAIYAVKKSYFKKDDYIKRQDFAEMWQDAIGADYIPFTDVRRIKPEKGNRKKDTIKGAVAEVAKYTVKGSDILRGDNADIDKAVYWLHYALTSRRLCAFGGIFKKAAKELKLDDLLDGDLILTDQEEEIRPDVQFIICRYKWQVGFGYQLESIEDFHNDDQRSAT